MRALRVAWRGRVAALMRWERGVGIVRCWGGELVLGGGRVGWDGMGEEREERRKRGGRGRRKNMCVCDGGKDCG